MIHINRFWDWERGADAGARVLYLDGTIAAESWYGDEVTPAAFRSELFAGKGDIIVWINSPGGDCVAASQIYAMLIDYPGNVIIKIDGIAASAASVIAMAGTTVLMAPTAHIIIHNPLTIAIGDEDEMVRARDMLAAMKESIINAYELKTGLDRDVLSNYMDVEAWFPAYKAIELGFADGLLLRDSGAQNTSRPTEVTGAMNSFVYSRSAVTNSLLDKLRGRPPDQPKKREQPKTPIADLDKRLALLL